MSLKIHSPMMVQSFEIDRLGVRSTRMRMKNLVTGFREAIPGAVALPQYVSGHGWRTEVIERILHVDHEHAACRGALHVRERVYALPANTPCQ